MNIELSIMELADCIKDLSCMITFRDEKGERDIFIEDKLKRIYEKASKISDISHDHTEIGSKIEITATPIFTGAEIMNFMGLWKISNGGFAKIDSWDDTTKLWTAILYQEDGVEAGMIYYDQFGNSADGNPHFQLDRRKRGDEKGWPNV